MSEEDPAGMNIKSCLMSIAKLKNCPYKGMGKFDGHEILFFEGCDAALFTLKRMHIHAENIDREIKADNLIFATTHSSAKKIHSLSVHTIGNWGNAEMGGRPRQICPVNPGLTNDLFLTLHEEWSGETESGWQNDYQVTLEATHHGPYVETPTAFIEIGSTIEQWSDRKAGRIIAKTILRVISGNGSLKGREAPLAFGIGGTHYCSNFNKRVLKGEVLLSHVCPKYALANFDENMLAQCMERTTQRPAFAFLDWKGLGSEKSRIVNLLQEQGVEIRRTR
ncbi:hypothetical protein D6764_04475 [Candidatus Woesearchaeota archaeon]|nr:MAG: hypothetical protein D6764_04475 [Candidatus Woesearchaeota archaeon]